MPVSNIEKATKFYSTLLGINGKRVSPGRHYFDCGGTILACFDPKADTDNFTLGPNPGHLYFAVNDLEERFKALRYILGVTPEDEIKVQPWGERSFYFKDPFGNKICFVDIETMFTG